MESESSDSFDREDLRKVPEESHLGAKSSEGRVRIKQGNRKDPR
ncbi:predicted protein [Chaetomium globosum CBS 148.51]|uniref:Uncharacterized protein n=1 Tax=Chaetomium globosum (strain ATCC 6205 / CBS 148.51 / DSM 1962 / NBRC 6347 / NRRL 1970) TaxID=306901 RepID=Q2GZ31_CHAGB|nr:uncharacterized protein CHGG_05215 [Chaetomium globosum CBS 148.51]EAQ88596.1 predicted protein [Chaetomium globosum CBS 148.51]